MLTRTPINTNTNSRTVRAAHTSSLARYYIQKAARKAALGRIYAHIDENSHKLHEVCVCFKIGTLTKIIKDLNGEFN